MRRCRCKARFEYVGHGKPLCPECMKKYRERSGRDKAAAKCKCGNVLGLRRQSENIDYCRRCEGHDLAARQDAALRRSANRLIEKGY